jgi:large subunit ribosomal protein L25
MSKVSVIKAEPRSKLGTHSTQKSRKNGLLPGVVYGHKKDTVSMAVPAAEFLQLFRHGTHLFELQISGKSETVLVKAIQYNYLGTDPIHVDFTRVDLNERVKVSVPVVLRGTPIGAQSGGVLQQLMMDIEIECVVTDIPELIKVNVAKLALDQSIHAKDLELPAGAKLVGDPESIVASVSIIEEVAEAAPAEAGAAAEPEVISKGKEEEEGEEGAEEKKA